MAEDFPEKMARVLRNKEWLNQDPPFESAFFFDKEVRDDGKRELSVVDLAYGDALSLMLRQEYRGSKIFLAGYTVLAGDKVKQMSVRYNYPLEYEHRPSRNNPAHGTMTAAFDGRPEIVLRRVLNGYLSFSINRHDMYRLARKSARIR